MLCFSFYRLKPFLQIGDDIVDMLCTNGKTDGVLLDSLIGKLFCGELTVGRRCRMDYKALDIGYIGKK